MSKIYGYKEKDVLELAQFIKHRKNKSLTKIFEEFALVSGKAKGTIRNMYYALAKESNVNGELRDKYFDGKPLAVGKIVSFDQSQEEELLKKVLLAKKEGRSVRSTITELSNGDMRLALRLQNKYRNSIKKNKELVSKILTDINQDGQVLEETPKVKNLISEVQFRRLKNEIDNLVDKISSKLKKENTYLKERLSVLELENLRLNNILYGGKTSKEYDNRLIKFFSSQKDKDMLS